MSEDRLLFSDLYEDLLKQRPTLIFPGQEERLRRGQRDPFYQFFKEQLRDYCLFIGYSFRHDVINEPILDNLSDGRIKKLGILTPNPQDNLENLFQGSSIPKEQIVKLPGRFGEENTVEQLNQWLYSSSRPYYRSPRDFRTVASQWKETREKAYIR